MNRFLTVTPGPAPLSIAVHACASVRPKQAQYDGGTTARIPKKTNGELVAGNQHLRFAYTRTGYPTPCSSISGRVAQNGTVAVCGSWLDPWKEPRTSRLEIRATGQAAGTAPLIVHAKHHFLTLEFTQIEAGSYSQSRSEVACFLGQEGHGQEGTVRGNRLLAQGSAHLAQRAIFAPPT
jgi:hypothetical protein